VTVKMVAKFIGFYGREVFGMLGQRLSFGGCCEYPKRDCLSRKNAKGHIFRQNVPKGHIFALLGKTSDMYS